MNDKLKPCPFCGQDVDLVFNGHAGRSPTGKEWWIACHNDACLYDNGVHSIESASAAIRSWNTRPVEDALRDRVAELEAQWASVPWGAIVAAWWAGRKEDDNAMMDVLGNWIAAHHPERGKGYIEITATNDFVWPGTDAPKEAAE